MVAWFSTEAAIDLSQNSALLYHHSDVICIKIDVVAYLRRVNILQNFLVGTIMLFKGEKPWLFWWPEKMPSSDVEAY